MQNREYSIALYHVYCIADSVYWIGGYDKFLNNNWFWLNGQEFTYQNWESGEPDNGKYCENRISADISQISLHLPAMMFVLCRGVPQWRL